MRTASVTDRERREMLTALLRGVSRSFYLTMRALPGPVRGQIGLAYLLARTADTIADTATLPPDERLARLLAFRAQVRRSGRVVDSAGGRGPRGAAAARSRAARPGPARPDRGGGPRAHPLRRRHPQ